ncbi:MAG TPA: hypothetical protein VE343_02150 [Streptosporangiaceae bacterium]|nr:hypothetical protein [Streptosporangiaceae bacterium]
MLAGADPSLDDLVSGAIGEPQAELGVDLGLVGGVCLAEHCILLGDPASSEVAVRGEDEGVGDAMAAKIRNALIMYRPLRSIDGVEIRFHRTVLYNSIYRADDQILVNTHLYGVTAAHAPVWHFRKVAGGEVAAAYLDSFERVWDVAEPAGDG